MLWIYFPLYAKYICYFIFIRHISNISFSYNPFVWCLCNILFILWIYYYTYFKQVATLTKFLAASFSKSIICYPFCNNLNIEIKFENIWQPSYVETILVSSSNSLWYQYGSYFFSLSTLLVCEIQNYSAGNSSNCLALLIN